MAKRGQFQPNEGNDKILSEVLWPVKVPNTIRNLGGYIAMNKRISSTCNNCGDKPLFGCVSCNAPKKETKRELVVWCANCLHGFTLPELKNIGSCWRCKYCHINLLWFREIEQK